MEKIQKEPKRLPKTLEELIRQTNPWWEGRPGKTVPPYRRWAFDYLLRHLKQGLAPAVVLRGPRQVGKTTLQEQIIDHLLNAERVDPRRIFRLQFDELRSLRGLTDPILEIVRWYQDNILGRTLNEAARANQICYLFFDEVQNQSAWAPQLKHLVDHFSVRVMVTGSSAFQIKAGHDSLAGRITTMELGPLHLREIAAIRCRENLPTLLDQNGIGELKKPEAWEALRELGEKHQPARDHAFAAYSERGGYPLAQFRRDWDELEVANLLSETVIQRAIAHDLGRRKTSRPPQLLAEVFRLACRYAGQSPGPAILIQELRHALQLEVKWDQVLRCLQDLDNTLLIRLVTPLEMRLKKHKGAAKICLCDPGIRAAWLKEVVPLDPAALSAASHLRDLAGRLAESVAGYFLGSLRGAALNHFPARAAEPEVDFILTIGDQRIPVEIKYQNQFADRDTESLRAFIEKTVHHASFGVLVTKQDGVKVRDPRIIPVPLRSLLLLQ